MQLCNLNNEGNIYLNYVENNFNHRTVKVVVNNIAKLGAITLAPRSVLVSGG